MNKENQSGLKQLVFGRPWARIAGLGLAIVAGCALLVFIVAQFYWPSPDEGQPGGPIAGLTPEQLRLFYDSKNTFTHNFTPEEGLGPVFNGRSCYECHGQPYEVGGEGKDTTSTGVIHISKRIGAKAAMPLDSVIEGLTQDDVDKMFKFGGPTLQRKSITSEFPGKYPRNIVVEQDLVPRNCDLLVVRHTGPLFGLGLIDAIPDIEITNRMFQEQDIDRKIAGRLAVNPDPLTERLRIGRFGYKAQIPTVLLFNPEAMRFEVGITTLVSPNKKFADVAHHYPPALQKLIPQGPNDKGQIMLQLAYFQSLLAPPPRGPMTPEAQQGEKIFEKLECAVCHVPEMRTGPVVKVPDPRSPAPKIHWMEVKALENKPVRAYSDFLLHQMGLKLADGFPQTGAKGGEWRTTPLWWLNTKQFYLHDGRATNLDDAILAHGGQAEAVTQNWKKLPDADKKALVAFLKTL